MPSKSPATLAMDSASTASSARTGSPGLRTAADAFLTGIVEQQRRSSFNFARRAFNAELLRRLTREISISGNYQIQRTELFDEQIRTRGQAPHRSPVSSDPAVIVFAIGGPRWTRRSHGSSARRLFQRERAAGRPADRIGSRVRQELPDRAAVSADAGTRRVVSRRAPGSAWQRASRGVRDSSNDQDWNTDRSAARKIYRRASGSSPAVTPRCAGLPSTSWGRRKPSTRTDFLLAAMPS